MKCSPSADSGAGFADVAASVSYIATATPGTINPVGATSDGSGGWAILVGQHCAPVLEGILSSCTVSNWQWSVSGTTLQSWTVVPDPNNQSHTTEVDGSGALNIESPGWYWNDREDDDETITCTATATPPTGQGSPFTVTASELVSVFVPDWTGSGTGGYVKVNTNPTSSDYDDYYIYAGATYFMEDAGLLNGMNIQATVQSPAPALFADGSLELVQIVTPLESWTDLYGSDSETVFPPDYGQEGLDNTYPYGWTSNTGPPKPAYTAGDTPNLELVDIYMIKANLKHDFEDYLMYLAPGSQQPVPVAHFVWNDDGTANLPTTGYWKDYASQNKGSDSAGTVTPNGTTSQFLLDNEFPSRTVVIYNQL